jgi:hypothetical protein
MFSSGLVDDNSNNDDDSCYHSGDEEPPRRVRRLVPRRHVSQNNPVRSTAGNQAAPIGNIGK